MINPTPQRHSERSEESLKRPSFRIIIRNFAKLLENVNVMPLSSNIGNLIRLLRCRYGYTQEEISRRLGISQPAYNKYEMGGTDVPASALDLLSDLYSVSKQDLICGNVDMLLADVAFRKAQNEEKNPESIAIFQKIVRNYIQMTNELEGDIR